MSIGTERRAAVFGLSVAALGVAGSSTALAQAAVHDNGSGTLSELKARLAKIPRRRDFRTVPMILDKPDLWDAAALRELITYRGTRKQVWDNTEIGGPWLNFMRNSINTQVFAFRHPDFLAVSATHGSAHLALFDQAMWDKYRLAEMAGGKYKTNSLIVARHASTDPSRFEDPTSMFGPAGDTIPALQSRGAVFMACHNAIWEQSGELLAKDINPDRLSHEGITAELTNHLVDGVVLTPGMVGTIPELQQAGYHYAK